MQNKPSLGINALPEGDNIIILKKDISIIPFTEIKEIFPPIKIVIPYICEALSSHEEK